MTTRRLSAIAAAVLAAMVIAIAVAPAASAVSAASVASDATGRMAHATLITTYPLDGALVKAEPARVTVSFDQPVGVSQDSLIVFTPAGQRADVGGGRTWVLPGPDRCGSGSGSG